MNQITKCNHNFSFINFIICYLSFFEFSCWKNISFEYQRVNVSLFSRTTGGGCRNGVGAQVPAYEAEGGSTSFSFVSVVRCCCSQRSPAHIHRHTNRTIGNWMTHNFECGCWISCCTLLLLLLLQNAFPPSSYQMLFK